MASPGSDEHFELLKYFFDCPRIAVIPSHDPLCCIAAAQNRKPRSGRVGFPALAHDIDEQATGHGCHRTARLAGRASEQHPQACFERGDPVLFVRESAREHKQHFVHRAQAGLCESQMRARRRIKSAGQNSEFLSLAVRAPVKFDSHNPLYYTSVLHCGVSHRIDPSTRRGFLSTGASLLAANTVLAQNTGLTARQVIERIQKNVGVPWRAETVDTFKDGSNPDAPLKGIATTMVATFDLLKRAAAANRNLIIVHEPTFYNHPDDPKDFVNDPMFLLKRNFIAKNDLSVFRFHDHWHARKPDGIVAGMSAAMGWTKYQNADSARLFTLPRTSLENLARDIRDRLKIRAVRVVGDPLLMVSKAAFNPGSTGLNQVMRYFSGSDIDVFVCGEPREWDTVEYARDSIASGKKMGLIILGHDMSEEAGMEECAKWLKTFVPEVPIDYMPAGEAFWTPK